MRDTRAWLAATVVVVVGAVAAAGPLGAAGTVLLGDQKVEAGNDSNAAGSAEAFRVAATGTGTLATVSVYVASTSASTKLVVGVYGTNGANTHPATLLAQGSLTAPVKGAWNTVPLTSRPPIVAGTSYWLAILSPAGSGTLGFRDVHGRGVSETSSQSSLASLPSSWATGAVYRDGPLSAYGAAAVTADTSAPSAPASLTVSGRQPTSLTLTWAASTDDVGVSGYRVYRDGAPAGTTAGTSFTYTGLACGTAYALGVEAFDAAGNVSTRTAAAASTSACPDTTPPTTPGSLVQTAATTSSISLSWDGSTDDRGVAGYGVYVGGARSASTTATSATLTGLLCGSSYTVGVDAFDAAGNRSQQATETMATAVCPPDTTPPTIPTRLAVAATTQTTLTLTWTASSDEVGVAGYRLFVDGDPHGSTTATQATLSGLACATSYTLGVGAFDAAGNASAVATIAGATSACPDTTPPAVRLTAPADGSGVSGTVVLSAAATDDVGVADVQFRVDGIDLRAPVTAPPFAVSWDTTAGSNGVHVLTAVARDAAGNTATSTPVSVTVANALARPTPVPPANENAVTVGPGYVSAADHQVVRTAAGTVYVIASDDSPCQIGGSGVIRAWKGSGAQPANSAVPTAFAEMDAAHHPVSGGRSNCQYTGGADSALFSPDSRLDSSGTIQLVYIDMYTRNLYYQTFSTSTDTWGPRIVLATYASKDSGFSWPRGGQAALTLDANDVPHVVYMTYGSSNEVAYTSRAGGFWSTPAILFAGTDETGPSLTTARDGTLHLTWLDRAKATHPVVRYAHFANGAWSAGETVSGGDANVLSDWNGDLEPTVATDRSGRPFVCYLDGTVSGPDDFVRVRYRTSAGAWVDDTPPGTAGGAASPTGTLFAHTPQIYLSQTDDAFVFLGHDALISPGGYSYQLAGPSQPWSPYATIDPRNKINTTGGYAGLDGSASTRYDPLRDNNPNIIDVLYYDEHDGTPGYYHHATLYYKAVALH